MLLVPKRVPSPPHARTHPLSRGCCRCYRPEEMTEPRNVTDPATGKTTEVDVCVWGFDQVEVPPQVRLSDRCAVLVVLRRAWG